MHKLEKSAAAWALTAWRLEDGAAVYRTAQGWSTRFPDAAVLRSRAEADAALSGAAADVEARRIVNPYLFEVAGPAGAPLPASARERLRAGLSSVA